MNVESMTLSVDDTAKLLGLSRNATYQGIHCGEIPSIRVGKRILVPRIAIERILSEAGTKIIKDFN
ncbi:helix-turn-helix domain-containing protein [Chloroflexota bacterium]